MLKLTSVKLLDNLYKKFKISNLDDNFTLQKLINRSMDFSYGKALIHYAGLYGKNLFQVQDNSVVALQPAF